MESLRSFLGAFHLAAGFVALAAFWLPLFAKKGGTAHRTAGWVFVGAMSVILASAATMTVHRIALGDRGPALFLGFLTLITFSAVWTGIRVLKHKQDPAWLRSPGQLAILVAIGGAALALLWQWYETRFTLLLVFGIVGLAIAVPDLATWRRPRKTEPRYWWHQHLASMIVSGMAAHIAFFAFGAMRIWPDFYAGQPWWLVLIPWVAPFPIAFTAIALIQRHYRRKFGGAPMATGTPR